MFFVSILMLLISQGTGFAQGSGNATFPRLEPDPEALRFYLIGAQADGYSWTDLAGIGLWASAGSITASHLEKIRSIALSVASSPDLPYAKKERAEFILSYMHRNLLKSYSLNQTRIDTVLANGRYNCVSSAVLYMIFCMSLGLDVSGVMTRDHAFATVHIDGEDIDVETTNPHGFDPGNRREFHDQFGRLTGFSYVPSRNYRDRQTINPVQLVSLVLSNRISEHERTNRFADAVPLAVDRAALLSGETIALNADDDMADSFFEHPRQDIMNRLFNYGAFLLNSGREEECIRWAAHAAPRYPDEKRWQEFILASVNNRLRKFLKSGNLAGARNFLDNQKQILNHAGYAQMDSMLFDSEILERVNNIRGIAESEPIIAAIEQGLSSGRISSERAAEFLIFAVKRTASAIASAPKKDWLSAINYLEGFIARFGSNRELEQTLTNYRNSRAADLHNRFAAEWNRKNFDEAERILNEGLAEFPGNRQLLADREIVKKYRPAP